MNVDVRVDERTLREIYLAAFEDVVKKAQPWTIMCSYNRINGKYSCENSWLLNQVLRKEWGYEGIVMTDWGAMNRRCESLEAGLDLEMPSSSGVTDKEIVEAVKSGALQETLLDDTVDRLLRWIDKGGKPTGFYDKGAHDALSEKLETECAHGHCGTVVENNHYVGLYLCHFFNEKVLAFRQIQMLSVEAF